MVPTPVRFGAYVLVDHLGRGGMGNVFLAVKGFQGLETVCVVKRLLPEFVADLKYKQRFHDEAGLARRFSHPNLVSTFDVGMVGDEMYLAQEHVQGSDLSEVMGQCWDQRKPMPVGLAVHIIRELAGALDYVHNFEGLNIVHRDINPPNIRIAYAGSVKLLDFGVAKSDVRMAPTTENEALGKPFFMAPEQLFDEDVDRRADVYVLGLVLWELLTLRPAGTKKRGDEIVAPREGRAQMLERVRASNYQPPSLFNDLIPPQLDQVVMRCLARDPNARYQSADELSAALRPFVAGSDPGKELQVFMTKLFDVDHAKQDLKRRIEEGSVLLQSKPDESQSADNSKVYEDRRRRRIKPALYVSAVICLAAAVYAIVEITKALETKGRVQVVATPEPPALVTPAPIAKVAASVLVVKEPPVDKPSAPPEPESASLPTERAKPAIKDARKSNELIAKMMDDAVEAFSEGKPLVANQILDQAIDLGAGAPARILKTKVYIRLGQFGDAEEQIVQAIKAEPKDKEALRLRDIIKERKQ